MFENSSFDVVSVRCRLLPCPFCGGSAEIVVLSRDVPSIGDVYGGVCLSCCSVGKPFNIADDAAEFCKSLILRCFYCTNLLKNG